ncbi:hypothetical protein KSP40_PGU019163 [Platanthera guangdongensis]|uniref:Uncharacterized protein n=1 Tax=Platanthera guangdongensis TaxID=2320717 RepID=A0ABR2LF06_9ASPA
MSVRNFGNCARTKIRLKPAPVRIKCFDRLDIFFYTFSFHFLWMDNLSLNARRSVVLWLAGFREDCRVHRVFIFCLRLVIIIDLFHFFRFHLIPPLILYIFSTVSLMLLLRSCFNVLTSIDSVRRRSQSEPDNASMLPIEWPYISRNAIFVTSPEY